MGHALNLSSDSKQKKMWTRKYEVWFRCFLFCRCCFSSQPPRSVNVICMPLNKTSNLPLTWVQKKKRKTCADTTDSGAVAVFACCFSGAFRFKCHFIFSTVGTCSRSPFILCQIYLLIDNFSILRRSSMSFDDLTSHKASWFCSVQAAIAKWPFNQWESTLMTAEPAIDISAMLRFDGGRANIYFMHQY